MDDLAHAGARWAAPDCTAESHRRSRADPGERPGTNGEFGGCRGCLFGCVFAAFSAAAALSLAAARTAAGGVEGLGVVSVAFVRTTMVSGGDPAGAIDGDAMDSSVGSVTSPTAAGESFPALAGDTAVFGAAARRAGVSGSGVMVSSPDGPIPSIPACPPPSALIVARASSSRVLRLSISARPFASAVSASRRAPSSVAHRPFSVSSSFSSLARASESSTTCRMSFATLRFSSGPRSWKDACAWSPRGTYDPSGAASESMSWAPNGDSGVALDAAAALGLDLDDGFAALVEDALALDATRCHARKLASFSSPDAAAPVPSNSSSSLLPLGFDDDATGGGL